MISEWGSITTPGYSADLKFGHISSDFAQIVSGDLYKGVSLRIENLPSYLIYIENLIGSNDIESVTTCISIVSNRYRGTRSASTTKSYGQSDTLEHQLCHISEIIENDLRLHCSNEEYSDVLICFSQIVSAFKFHHIAIDLCASAADSNSTTFVLYTLAHLEASVGNHSAALESLGRIALKNDNFIIDAEFELRILFWQANLHIADDSPREAQEYLKLIAEISSDRGAHFADNYRMYLWATTESMLTGSTLPDCLQSQGMRLDGHENTEEETDSLWSSAWIAYQEGQIADALGLFNQLQQVEPQSAFYRELALEGMDYCQIVLGKVDQLRLQLQKNLERVDSGEYLSAIAPLLRCIALASGIADSASVPKRHDTELHSRLRRRVQRFFPNSRPTLLKALEIEARSLRSDGSLHEAKTIRSAIDGLLTTSLSRFGSTGYELVNRLWLGVLGLELQDFDDTHALFSRLVDEMGSTGDSFDLDLVARVGQLATEDRWSSADLVTLGQEFEQSNVTDIQSKNFDLWLWAASMLIKHLIDAGSEGQALALLDRIGSYPELKASPLASRSLIHASYGRCFYAQRRYLAASSAYRAAFELLAAGHDSTGTEGTLLKLGIAECYWGLGDYRAAMNAYKAIWTMDSKDFSSSDDIQRRSILGYARSLEKLGAYKGAAMNYARVRELDAQAGGPHPHDTLKVLFGEARCWERHGSLLKASEGYRRLLEGWTEGLDPLRVPIDHIRHRLTCCQSTEQFPADRQGADITSLAGSTKQVSPESTNTEKAHRV